MAVAQFDLSDPDDHSVVTDGRTGFVGDDFLVVADELDWSEVGEGSPQFILLLGCQ